MPVTVDPATKEDFLEFVGTLPPHRVQAWAGKLDGKVIGIGGLLFLPDGSRIAFLDLDPEARRYSHALHRAGLRFAREVLKQQGVPIIATTAEDFPRASVWLERLGFTTQPGNVHVFNLQADS